MATKKISVGWNTDRLGSLVDDGGGGDVGGPKPLRPKPKSQRKY